MKHISYLLIFLIIISFTFCSTKSTKIACVGDSITEGYGLKIQGKTGYPVILNQILGKEYTVLNLGRSATTMSQSGDFPYWITKEFSNIFAYSPDIILIKLGTNDSKEQNWDAAAYRKSYQAMIDTFQAIDPHIELFLCLPAPVFKTKWGINDSTVTAEIIPIIEKLSIKNNLPIIDLHEGLRNESKNFPDGIHPNEQGVKVMANIISDHIQQSN